MNYYRSLQNCFLFSIFIFVFQLASAAPVIQEITKDEETGFIIVKGSGFGNGPTIHLFDEFEASQADDGEEIPLESPLVGKWARYGASKPVYDNQESVSGDFSALTFDSDANYMRQFQGDFGEGVQEVFMSYWVRIPDGTHFPGMTTTAPEQFPGESTWKFNWLIDQDYRGNSSDVVLPTHTGYGKFALAGNDGVIHQLSGKGEWWSWNSWNRISVWLKANTSDPTADGNVVFQVVSEEKGLYKDTQLKPVFDEDGPVEKQYQSFNFPGWIREAGGDMVQPLYDDIYIAVGSSSNARLEISNNKDLSKSNKIAIQIPVAWTDTEITFDPRNGLFSDLEENYLFITDSEGVSNDDGFIFKLKKSIAVAPCFNKSVVVSSNGVNVTNHSCDN